MTPLHAPGLLLRAFEPDDAPAFAAAVRESVDSVGRWMPWSHAGYSVDEALAWFTVCRDSERSGQAFEYGIFDAASGEFVGGAGLNAISALHRFCNLGYWVRQSRQRQGVALRVVQRLAQQAFEDLGLCRVEIVVACDNLPSQGVALRAGALREGVARNRLQLNGGPVPAFMFSLVPDEAR